MVNVKLAILEICSAETSFLTLFLETLEGHKTLFDQISNFHELPQISHTHITIIVIQLITTTSAKEI